jgi:hypothetical protein
MKRPEGTRLSREAAPRLRTTTTRPDDPDIHCASRCKDRPAAGIALYPKSMSRTHHSVGHNPFRSLEWRYTMTLCNSALGNNA